jgi:hypothetical protein
MGLSGCLCAAGCSEVVAEPEGDERARDEAGQRFDEAGFKRKHPDLHADFTRPAPQRILRLLWP